jgi:hypothetical protein
VLPGRAINEGDFGNPLGKFVACASVRDVRDAANPFVKNAVRRSPLKFANRLEAAGPRS